FRVCFGMLGTRHARTIAHSLQVIPPALRGDLTAQGALHPLSHLGSTPQSSILGRLLQRCCEFLLLLSRQQGFAHVDVLAMISDACFPLRVPPLNDRANPPGRVTE